MVTSFADGSKISFEQTIVANATGFKVQARGMSRGLSSTARSWRSPALYDVDEVRALGGDRRLHRRPAADKVFCLAEHRIPSSATT